MDASEIADLQKSLGLSDGKMAQSLGVTRQTWRNWRTGRRCPEFAQKALCWMMELRKLSPANDNLPVRIRQGVVALLAVLVLPEILTIY